MRYLSLLIVITCLSACSYEMPETDDATDRFNDEEFTRFYVIGDGFSAGFMDGTLTSESQSYSYPNFIGGKINEFFDADLFRQADIETSLGLNRFEQGTVGKYRLFYRNPGDEVPARRTAEGEMPLDWPGDTGLLRDFSIPGIRTYQINNLSEPSENLYLDRLPFSDTQTILDVVTDQQPNVVLVSLGYGDLLPFVLGNATGDTNSPISDISDIDATPVPLFESSLRSIVNRLQTDTGTSLILSTVPDPLLSPTFNTVSYSMELGSEITGAEIGQLNSFYSKFNDRAFEYNLSDTVSQENQRPFIDFDVNGGAPFKARVIVDPSLPDVIFDDGYELPKIRQMSENEYLAFGFREIFFENPNYGKTEPVQPEDIITLSNVIEIQQLLDGYNNVIRDLASSSDDIHLLDVEQIISELFNGELQSGGVFFNAEFSRESLYSADGLFLNPKGNAVVAQRLVEILNREYNVALLPVDVNNYPGLSFEQDF